jgi:hypothetical protein
MSRLVRTVSRLVRRPVHQPWEYERLATPEEQLRLLGKTDLMKAA